MHFYDKRGEEGNREKSGAATLMPLRYRIAGIPGKTHYSLISIGSVTETRGYQCGPNSKKDPAGKEDVGSIGNAVPVAVLGVERQAGPHEQSAPKEARGSKKTQSGVKKCFHQATGKNRILHALRRSDQ